MQWRWEVNYTIVSQIDWITREGDQSHEVDVGCNYCVRGALDSPKWWRWRPARQRWRCRACAVRAARVSCAARHSSASPRRRHLAISARRYRVPLVRGSRADRWRVWYGVFGPAGSGDPRARVRDVSACATRAARDDDPRACQGHGAAARSESGRARYYHGLRVVCRGARCHPAQQADRKEPQGGWHPGSQGHQAAAPW